MHGELPIITEKCEVVVIAGDTVPLDVQGYHMPCKEWVQDTFLPWVDSLPCEKVIMIAGNHDLVFERKKYVNHINLYDEFIQLLTSNEKIIYLCDSSYEYKGKTFYGTPWITQIGYSVRWAFEVPDDTNYMQAIPDCDVLISHASPFGEIGTSHQGWNYGRNFGSLALRDRLKKGGIKYCISGHIHTGIEHEQIGQCHCRNVSIVDEHYNVHREPVVMKI